VRREPRHDRGAPAAAVIRIVIPHAGPRGKTRLGAAREELSAAMLGHVVATAASVGRAWVVSPGPVTGAEWIPDPGGGQGAAVEAALSEIGPGPVLIVNSDLPSLTDDDLRALHDAIPTHGIAIAAAPDGTTNALGLSDASVFAPLYGPDSAARFRAHAGQAVDVVRPGLRDDVDTPADVVTV
jgi:2-phospho-L-lactate/phosphoenolpyruvate guanylyltransferase